MIECIKSGGLEIAAHNASRPIPASAFLSREPLRTPIARKAVELLSDIGCGPNEPQANRSARVSQWFHHQSQSCKGHLCLARQAGDGPDRQRFVCRRVFRGNQDPAHQTRRERRDLPHGRIACAARNRLTHINGHRAPLFHQSHIHLGATAQRIPVRVHITHVPPGVLVSAGMTCTVVIKKGTAPQIGLGMKKVMTAIFRTPSS